MKWLFTNLNAIAFVLLLLAFVGCKSVDTDFSYDVKQTYYKTEEGFIVKTETKDFQSWSEFKITSYYEVEKEE